MPLNDETASAVLLALLWSPPDAARFATSDAAHKQGRDHAASLLGETAVNVAGPAVEHASQRAAAADYLPGRGPDYQWGGPLAEAAVVGHPFASREYRPAAIVLPETSAVAAAVLACRDDKIAGAATPWHLALAVWRFLPELVAPASAPPGEAARWRRSAVARPLYPDAAEDVGALRAAVAATNTTDANQNTAVLLFSLASVQEYIGEARRTQDLWMGSYLYAYFIWHAIRAVIERIGPWAIITPSLRTHPFVDLWLENQGITMPEPDPGRLALASLPNVFSAIVPLDQGEPIAEAAIAGMATAGDRVANAVRDHLKDAVTGAAGEGNDAQWGPLRDAEHDTWLKLWDEQIAELAVRDAFWVLVPWETPGADRARLEALAAPAESWTMWASLDGPARRGSGFSLASDLAARLHNSRKNRREFGPAPDADSDSLCTLCAARAALRPSNMSAKQFWETVATVGKPVKLQGRIRAGERLCAPCAMKRLAGDAYFDQDRASTRDRAGETKLAFDRHRFPSTATVATAPFRTHLQKALANDPADFVKPKLIAWLEAIDSAVAPRHRVPANIPRRLWMPSGDPALIPLDSLDGSWLDGNAYQASSVSLELGVPVDQTRLDAAAMAWRGLRSALEKWSERSGEPGADPARYYAVLALDGDQIGNWLRGAKNPTFSDLVGPGINPHYARGNRDALALQRPPGPLSQMALAAAGHAFALGEAPRIVKAHDGWLVYAGGDDVLALAPRESAFGLARALETAFRQWATNDGELLLGGQATMSAAVVIAHVADPLGNVIRTANGALKHLAKATYGRDAFVVSVLKRSGPAFAAGLPWRVNERDTGATLDAGADFDTLRRAIASGVLSRGLLTDVRHRQQALGSGAPPPPAGARPYLRQMLLTLSKRHVHEQPHGPSPVETCQAVEDLFAAAEAALEEKAEPKATAFRLYPKQEDDKRPTAWDVFVDLLRAAEFLAREDKE